MKISNLFSKVKDGGPESPVEAYFLIEIKSLFSIAVLKFNKGGREAYHTHAFNAFTWFLKGELEEQDVHGDRFQYSRGLLPKVTKREKNHRVLAKQDSWCLTFRGPWAKQWTEYKEAEDQTITMTTGRVVINIESGIQ